MTAVSFSPARRPRNQDCIKPGVAHCRRDDRTWIAASSRSSPSIATAVCDPLCGSTPIIAIIDRSSSRHRRRTTVGTPDSGGSALLAPLSSHTTIRTGRADSFVRKPDATRAGRQFESQPDQTPDATEPRNATRGLNQAVRSAPRSRSALAGRSRCGVDVLVDRSAVGHRQGDRPETAPPRPLVELDRCRVRRHDIQHRPQAAITRSTRSRPRKAAHRGQVDDMWDRRASATPTPGTLVDGPASTKRVARPHRTTPCAERRDPRSDRGVRRPMLQGRYR